MSWLDHLDSDEIVELKSRCRSTRRAALEAMRHPDYVDEFTRIGARIGIDADGQEYEVVPYREIEGTFARLVVAALTEADRHDGERDDTIGRPLEPLVSDDVLEAGRELAKRAALAKPPRSGPFTYTAIATRTGLNRDRLKELEQLMRLGWPLDKSHPDVRLRKSRPDISAETEVVWLPTPRQARRLLASG